MTDEHDRQLTEHTQAMRDQTPYPGGWDDVLRRADKLVTDNTAAPRSGGRWKLGGLAAVAAAVAIVAILFVAGLWDRNSPDQGAAAGLRGVRYITTQTSNFTNGTGSVRGSLGLEHRVDFERRIDHYWAVDWPVGMRPEPPQETIVTAQYVYHRVPLRRRAQSHEKAWVRFPLDMDWGDLYPVDEFADPIAAYKARHTGTPKLVGPDRVIGHPARHYRAEETMDGSVVLTNEYWIDDAGRLLRSLTSSPSQITADTNTLDLTILEHDAPIKLLEPPPQETLDVGSRSQAEALLDLQSQSRSSDPDVPHVVIEASGQRMSVPMSVETTMDVSRTELIYTSPTGTRYLEAPAVGGEAALCIVELLGPPNWTAAAPSGGSPCTTRAQLTKQGGWLFVQRTPGSSTVSGVAILPPGDEAVAATTEGASLTPMGRAIPFSSVPLATRELRVTTRTGSRTIPLPTPAP